MDDKTAQAIALFRFSLIAPVVNNTFEARSKIAFFREIAAKSHTLPSGEVTKLSSKTLKKYYESYLHYGLDGLIPKTRSDAGKSRVLDEKIVVRIHEIKEKFPHITGSLVYQKLIEEGTLKASEASLSSVLRYIRQNNLSLKDLNPVDRKAFEMSHANDLWQADTSHGPVIKVNGAKRQTYLIAILDDASRLIVHGEFFFEDNALNLQICLKKAISKYGIPKRLYVDNGKTYKNEQLGLICASLGTVLIHTKPYTPQSKGKIERSFRTVKDGWLNGVDWANYQSLDAINTAYHTFLANCYNNAPHSALNMAPRDRYLQDSSLIKLVPPEILEHHFLHRVVRKVTSDATVKLYTVSFQVPMKYIGKQITIRYFPGNLAEAYIYEDLTTLAHTIYPLDKVANSYVKRKESIDYTCMRKDEKDV